jgi:hypothetical protein
LAHESRGQDLTGPNSRRETAALRDEVHTFIPVFVSEIDIVSLRFITEHDFSA